jgi:hypothetical protein
VLVGAAGALHHDFSVHWYREVTLLGSWVYSADEFAETVAQLPSLAGIESIVSRRYALADYRAALGDIRARRVLKAVFEPSAETRAELRTAPRNELRSAPRAELRSAPRNEPGASVRRPPA